jgi:hypothetical protein
MRLPVGSKFTAVDIKKDVIQSEIAISYLLLINGFENCVIHSEE